MSTQQIVSYSRSLSQRAPVQAVRTDDVDFCRDIAPEIIGGLLITPIAVAIVLGIALLMQLAGVSP